MEPCEVSLEAVSLLEVDVEREQVEKRQIQVLRRRVVDVGDETAGILVLHGFVEALEVALDRSPAKPAGERRLDLVAERVAQDRRVAGDGHDLVAHDPLEIGSILAISEISRVLLSRKADHDLEAVVLRQIEQRPRWHRVRDADDVYPALDHEREVPVDHFGVVVLLTG